MVSAFLWGEKWHIKFRSSDIKFYIINLYSFVLWMHSYNVYNQPSDVFKSAYAAVRELWDDAAAAYFLFILNR